MPVTMTGPLGVFLVMAVKTQRIVIMENRACPPWIFTDLHVPTVNFRLNVRRESGALQHPLTALRYCRA